MFLLSTTRVAPVSTCYLILPTAASSLVSFCWMAVVVFSSGGCNAGSLICVWDFFLFFLEEWYCPMACITSEAVQWWRVRASCRVKGPSLVRLTPLHTAVLSSSSPISCTTLRKYFWVSFRHCTSVRTEKKKHQIRSVSILKIGGFLCVQLKIIYLKWSLGAGSECNVSLSK